MRPILYEKKFSDKFKYVYNFDIVYALHEVFVHFVIAFYYDSDIFYSVVLKQCADVMSTSAYRSPFMLKLGHVQNQRPEMMMDVLRYGVFYF